MALCSCLQRLKVIASLIIVNLHLNDSLFLPTVFSQESFVCDWCAFKKLEMIVREHKRYGSEAANS